jgi:hypothetical protein
MGIDGITKWKASEALPPCAVGLVSGSTIFNCSTTEPAVRYDQRQRILVLRMDMCEVYIQPVDFSDEVRHGRASTLRQS